MARESWVIRNGELIPKHLAAPRVRRADGLQVIKDIEPYQNVIDKKVIGGRKQHRDFLRAHNVIEVGTDSQKGQRTYDEGRHDRAIEQTMRRVINGG